MSFFEDQESDWMANDCKGRPEQYDGAGNFDPSFDVGDPAPHVSSPLKRSTAQKRRDQRRRSIARNAEKKQQASPPPA